MRFILGVWLGRAGLHGGGVAWDGQERTAKSQNEEPLREFPASFLSQSGLCFQPLGLSLCVGSSWSLLGTISRSRVQPLYFILFIYL